MTEFEKLIREHLPKDVMLVVDNESFAKIEAKEAGILMTKFKAEESTFETDYAKVAVSDYPQVAILKIPKDFPLKQIDYLLFYRGRVLSGLQKETTGMKIKRFFEQDNCMICLEDKQISRMCNKCQNNICVECENTYLENNTETMIRRKKLKCPVCRNNNFMKGIITHYPNGTLISVKKQINVSLVKRNT